MFFAESEDYKKQVVSVRRKLRRVAKNKITFIGETQMKENTHSLTTLALAGDTGKVVVSKPESFAGRVDFIAAANAEQTFPLAIFTPKERQKYGCCGITKAMFNDFLETKLAPAICDLDEEDLLIVIDRARVHNVKEIDAILDNNGCDNVKEIILLPRETAKHVSPLDNALFHDFKQGVRERLKNKEITFNKIKAAARREWGDFDSAALQAHYRHCRLYSRQSLSSDLD